MAKLVWHKLGDQQYEVGVDRGVLYTLDGKAVPWNGLIQVEQIFSGDEEEHLYFDSAKYGHILNKSDFSANLRAYTYPDEFLSLEGILEVEGGFYASNQTPKRFNLSYRTMVGNDILKKDLAYKIHLLYNVTATPSDKNYQTLSSEPSIMEFEWNITTVPSEAPGYQPTAHVIIDSLDLNGFLLETLENMLYGTDTEDARVPSLSWLIHFIENWSYFNVVDHGNGTWSVTGPDQYFSMLDATTFEISDLEPVYLDSDTYQITNIIKSKEY